jgi:hypothetical protein
MFEDWNRRGKSEIKQQERQQLRNTLVNAVRKRGHREVIVFTGSKCGLIYDILPVGEIIDRNLERQEKVLQKASELLK